MSKREWLALRVVGVIAILVSAIGFAVPLFATAEDGNAHLNIERTYARMETTGVWNSSTGYFHEIGGDGVANSKTEHIGFNPVDRTWVSFADLPQDVYGGDAVVGYDGDIYVSVGIEDDKKVLYWNRTEDSWINIEDLDVDIGDPCIWYNPGDYRMYIIDGDSGGADYKYYSHSVWALGAGDWTDEGQMGFDTALTTRTDIVELEDEIYGIYGANSWEQMYSWKQNKSTGAITQIADNRTAMGGNDSCYLAFEYQDKLYGVFNPGAAAESLDNAEIWEYTGAISNSWTVADNTTDFGSGLRDDGNSYDGFCLDGVLYMMNAHNESSASQKVLIAYPWYSTTRTTDISENTGSGNKTGNDIESIAWVGLRCAYADELLGFEVSGNISADIALSLVSEGGSVLDSTTNTIRANGKYYWQTSVADSYRGFVRCIESNTGVQSEWGYIHPEPDDTMTHNYGYARYTSYPQDDIAFDNYVIDGSDMLVFHWGTDLEVADLSNYYVGVWREGLYSQYAWHGMRLDTLLNDYYKNSNTTNDDMVGYRYLLMALNPGAGYESYDDLIWRMNIDLDWESEGFYEVVIYDGSQNRHTDAASVYWYLEDTAGGFAVSLDDTQYLPAEDMIVYIDIDEGTGLLGLYDSTTIYIYNSDDAQIRHDEIEDRSLNMQVTMVAPTSVGTYTLTVKFEDEDQAMDVVQSVSFTVVDEDTWNPDPDPEPDDDDDDPWPTIPFTDTAGGRWSLMLSGMLICFVIVKDSAVLRVTIPLGILGLGIVLGWVETWIIVLLALGAGFTLFGVFKKRFSGSYQGE